MSRLTIALRGASMICPKCNSQQPDTAQFCSQCSEPLTEGGKKLKAKRPAWVWFVCLVVLVFLGLQIYQAQQRNQAAMTSLHVTAAERQPQSHVIPIVNSATTVNASAYAWYTFVIPPGATTIALDGHFAATGGAGNDIECYVLDEDGFVNFRNGHPATTFFNSGRVTQAKLRAALSTPGTYYIMLDNRFSLITPKAVQIEATLSYMQ